MKKVVAFLVLASAALALVACGGGSDTSSTPTSESSGAAAGGGEAESGGGSEEAGGSTVAFEADPGGGIAYTSDTATAKAGKVTVNFNNPQALEHDVAIEDSSGQTIGQTELVTEGSDSTTVDLKPGTYTFYCTVPGHREAGMEGTLTVE
ncbi:MAG TPA: plastocyanin/azurin family copper-binding protein [Solirubrobacterales bacterium]|jgi:plastocyanin